MFGMYVYMHIRVYTFIRKLFLHTRTVQCVNNNLFILINMNLCTILLHAFAKICRHICARKKTNADWMYTRLRTQIIHLFFCTQRMLQLTINNIVLFNQSKIKKGGRLAEYAKDNKIQDPAGPWNLVAICDAPKVFESLNFFRDLIFEQTFV